MSTTTKVVSVFIASPGGLDEERTVAHEVAQEINRNNAEHWGCQLKLVGWEDTIPGYQRPQSRINQDLDKCEYFIGIMWNRWGSRPSSDKDGYTSGFEEEFHRAKQRILERRMKDLVLYFKKVEVPEGMEPGEDVKKVLSFRDKCIEDHELFFGDFTETREFRELVRAKLTDIGWQETKLLYSQSKTDQQSEQRPNTATSTEHDDASTSRLIDTEASAFLTELSKRSSDWDTTSSDEIARLRLIGSALNRSGNDDAYIGNHDANLIFQTRNDNSLSYQEVRSLVDCGVAGFEHQNVPLWHWISKSERDSDIFDRVRVLACVGNTREKKNSIRILQSAALPIPTLGEGFGKKEVLSSWLSDETDHQVFDAAISFLNSNAMDSDLPTIEETIAECSSPRAMRIEASIAHILARKSVNVALQRLIEKEIDRIDDKLAETLFQKPESIPTTILSQCLNARADAIRLRAAEALFARDEIKLEAAEDLLTDSSHEVRLIAAESLKKLGNELDESIAKKVLTKEKRSGGFGLFGSQVNDSSLYDQYTLNRLSELDLDALRQKANEAGFFGATEMSALYSQFSSKLLPEIRNKLADGFTRHLDLTIEQAEQKYGAESATIPKLKALIPYQKRILCTNALAAVCKQKKAEDLELVRNTVDKFDVDATQSVLQFFSKFGDWSDIDRVKRLGNHAGDQTSLLTVRKTPLPEQKAKAIQNLGKKRIVDLFSLELDGDVRKSIPHQMSNKSFIELSNETIKIELDRDDDQYRAIFALRCVQSLPKTRITKLLDLYVSRDGHRYYNSIHWLDLGASLPQKLARQIAAREILRL